MHYPRLVNVFSLCLLSLFVIFAVSDRTVYAQKLEAEDVLAKHLESIGSPVNPSPVKNRVFVGTSSFKDRQLAGEPAVGKALLVSEPTKVLVGMSFNMLKYPQEQMSFDGEKAHIGFIMPNVRSPLGEYILIHDKILKEGLLGGTLSSAWSLTRVSEKKPTLEYEGTKKINGNQTHVMSYNPRGGSDVGIKLYFDAQNFQHVRTEYRRVIAARQGVTIDSSAGQTGGISLLVEEFSNYKKINGLNLPSKYRLQLSFNRSGGSQEYEWNMEFNQYAFNQSLGTDAFNIQRSSK